jgi:hypothetical protein
LRALRRNAPNRPPNWRWRRAAHRLATGRAPSRIIDDADVERAMHIQQEISQCGGDPYAYEDLANRNPDLIDAFEIATDNSDGAKHTRWHLEACLLCADLNAERTAPPFSLRPEAVTLYEKLFFNVVDRLNNSTWIVNHAIGPSVHTGVADHDIGAIWKLVGYCGGAAALDRVTTVLPRELLGEPAMAEGWFRQQTRGVIQRRALLETLKLRARDAFAKLQLLELNRSYEEVEQATQGPVGGDERLLDSVRMMLDQVRFLVKSPGAPSGSSNILPNGVELRAADTFRVAAGLPIDLPQAMRDAKFPPPRTVATPESDDDEDDDE